MNPQPHGYTDYLGGNQNETKLCSPTLHCKNLRPPLLYDVIFGQKCPILVLSEYKAFGSECFWLERTSGGDCRQIIRRSAVQLEKFTVFVAVRMDEGFKCADRVPLSPKKGNCMAEADMKNNPEQIAVSSEKSG